MKYTAVVLAGSRPGQDPLAERFGTGLKALIPVAGEPMVRHPVRALLASEWVANVIVVAQAPERLAAVLADDPGLDVRPSQATIADTLEALRRAGSIGWPLLVTTADHALLDTGMIGDFCNAARSADIGIGVVERRSLMARLPQTRRTWIRLRGGAYSGANLFALSHSGAAAAVSTWRAVEQDRKKALRILWRLGPFAFLGALLRVRTLDQLLDGVGRRFGLSIKAVRLSNPLAAVDVDKPDDHALVEAILEGRA